MKRLRTLLVVMLVTVLSLGCLSLNVKAEEAKETQEVTEVEQLDSQNNDDVVLEDENNIVDENDSSQEDGEVILEEEVEVNQDNLTEELVPLQSGTEENIEDVPYDPTLEPVEITPTERLIIKVKTDSMANPHIKITLKINPYVDENKVEYPYYGYAEEMHTPGYYDYVDGQYVFELDDRSDYEIHVAYLYVGQDYELTIDGIENHKTKIKYLCKAGREKISARNKNESNSVACTIHDSSKPESVTNPDIINIINVKVNEVIESDVMIPLIEEYHIETGGIGRRANSKLTRYLNILYADSLEEAQAHDLSSPFLDNTVFSFASDGKNQDNIPIVLYEGENIDYIKKPGVDVFRKVTKAPLNIASLNLTPNQENHLYFYTDLNKELYEIQIYEMLLNVDENGDVTDWKLYQVDGENRVEVNELYFVYSEVEKASLTIGNNTPSFVSESFDYELTIQSENTEAEYTVNESTFKPKEKYIFSLKDGEKLKIRNIDFGSTYTVKQKKNEDVISTSAYKNNSQSTDTIELKENDEWHIVQDVQIGTENIFIEVDSIEHVQVPEPCHPQVPEPIGYNVPYYLYWNNVTDDDLKIIIRKSDVPFYYPDYYREGGYYGESTLEGAVFELSGTDGYKAVDKTDKNGVAVFEGLNNGVKYTINETIAPKGHQLVNKKFVYDPYGGTQNLNETDENVYEGELLEPPATTKLEVRKFFLPDESKYDGERFEVLNFVFNKFDYGTDPEEVKYRDSVWPRSFFKDIEGVEFIMTLDSDPENPRYTYKAVTGSNGRAFFERVLPPQLFYPEEEGGIGLREPDSVLREIYYGTYTIKEVKAPAGMRKMEDQHITITPSSIRRSSNTEQITVVRVVNVAARGDLTISKTVEGNNADKNKEFEFTVNLKDKDGNVLTDEYKYEGSKSGSIKSGDTIKLKHGESITIKDLPESTKYEAIEEKVEEYTTKVNGSTTDRISGEIADQEVAKAQFVNTLPDKPEEPIKEEPPKEDPPKETPVEPEKPREYRQPKTGI